MYVYLYTLISKNTCLSTYIHNKLSRTTLDRKNFLVQLTSYRRALELLNRGTGEFAPPPACIKFRPK